MSVIGDIGGAVGMIPGLGFLGAPLGAIDMAFGGSDGPSAADIASTDCHRWLNDPTLSQGYLADALANYSACQNKADDGKIRRCAAVADCIRQVMAMQDADGLKQVLTGGIAFTDSQGQVRKAKWVKKTVSGQTSQPATATPHTNDTQTTGAISSPSDPAPKDDSNNKLIIIGGAILGGLGLAWAWARSRKNKKN
jgi:hypothetical protein